MHNRYRTNDSASPDDLQQQLDRTVADRLPALLDRGLSRLQQRLGLPADSLVTIRRVNVRLRLADAPSATAPAMVDTIATAWSRAILSGMERILTTAGFAPGQVLLSDTLAVFPDLSSARRHHLRQTVRTGAAPWWSAALLGDDAAPSALPRLLTALASSDPWAAAAAIIELADHPGPEWLDRLDTGQQHRLEKLFARANGHAGGGNDAASDRAIQSEKLASLHARYPGRLQQSRDAALAALLYCALQVADGQPIAPDYVSPDKAVTDDAVPSTDTADDEEPVTEPSMIPVGCGGLLFLIRFALQHRNQDSDNLNQDMLALGAQLLDGVFDRLSPAAQRAAWRRDRGLLQVFAGLREPIEDIDALDHPPAARRWAATLCDMISGHINADIGTAANACEYVLGAAEAMLSPLDRLLLRPGRLWVTETDARLFLPSASLDIGLRRGGWDIDPGWVPQLGRIIRFEYSG